jgi:glutamate dehydrogenase/leucine dehydrogenase
MEVHRVEFEQVKACVDVPEAAERLLSKSEKEITFSLNLILHPEGLVETDAYVVYHNTARGPAKGGVRIWPTVTLEHTRELAELMTYKTALVGVPFGGGKSAIRLDPAQFPVANKTALIKEYVHMIAGELRSGAYVPAPDLGSTPSDMAVIYGETHLPESVTGRPAGPEGGYRLRGDPYRGSVLPGLPGGADRGQTRGGAGLWECGRMDVPLLAGPRGEGSRHLGHHWRGLLR